MSSLCVHRVYGENIRGSEIQMPVFQYCKRPDDEQLNAILKGDGGITRLIEYATQLFKLQQSPSTPNSYKNLKSEDKVDLKHHKQHHMF